MSIRSRQDVHKKRRTALLLVGSAVRRRRRATVGIPADLRKTVSTCSHFSISGPYQKNVAVRTIRDLMGVKGVTDNIVVRPQVKTLDVRDKIEAAFKRSAEVDARRISVVAEDGKVILCGNVRSWAEREEAERAAWAAPGVKQVDDRISVVP